MGRLFLGACHCSCGYVADRIRREDPAGQCPRCERLMKKVTLEAIRTEETILQSVMNFTRLTSESIQEGWIDVGFDKPIPYSRFDTRNFAPIVYVGVKPDWMIMVHKRGLDRLPKLEVHKYGVYTGFGKRLQPVFILDAELGWIQDGVKFARAVWSSGGRTEHKGYLAWRCEPWSDKVTSWAVSTTEKRVLLRLQKIEAAIAAVAEAKAKEEAGDMSVLGDFA
jgi:hypothetical protein